MMTQQQRAVLRARIGTAFLDVQEEYREMNFDAEEVVPELIGAMLSLAVFVARKSGVGRAVLTKAFTTALQDEFARGPQE